MSERDSQIPEFTCTLLGSFRFIDQINLVRAQLESVGITVLAPKRGNIVREVDGFRILDTDYNQSPEGIERNFLECLFGSHFAYIVNPGGYIGDNAAEELGLAQATGVPIMAMERLDPELDDAPVWKSICQSITVRKVEHLVNFLRDPVSRMARAIEYEKGRQHRQPEIEKAINRAIHHAQFVLLDWDKLGPGWWKISSEKGRPEHYTDEQFIEGLKKQCADLGQPVRLYIAGLGITLTYTPEKGFKREVPLKIPRYIDPPGIQTFGFIEIND